jgi:hypothetical protein
MKDDVVKEMESGKEPPEEDSGFRTWLYQQIIKKKAEIVWIIVAFLFLIFEGALVFIFFDVLSSELAGAIAVAFFAGLFVGCTLLLVFPAKVVTTFLGGLLGIGASDGTTGDGIITKLNEKIIGIAKEIELVVATPAEEIGAQSFILYGVWTFVITLIIICCFAFRKDTFEGGKAE